MIGARSGARQDGEDVLLTVRVHPRASRNTLSISDPPAPDVDPGGILIRVTAPPVAGAANAACRGLLADLLGIPQSRITIERGDASRRKCLRIRNMDAATLLARLKPSG